MNFITSPENLVDEVSRKKIDVKSAKEKSQYHQQIKEYFELDKIIKNQQIKENDPKEWKSANDKQNSLPPISLGKTPISLQIVGVDNLELQLYRKTLTKKKKIHHLEEKDLLLLYDGIRKPLLILEGSTDSKKEKSFLLFTEHKDYKDDYIVTSVLVKPEKRKKESTAYINEITTIYGKDKLPIFFTYNKEKVIAYNDKKTNKLLNLPELQLLNKSTLIGFNDNIPYLKEEVKNQIIAGTYVSTTNTVDKEVATTEEKENKPMDNIREQIEKNDKEVELLSERNKELYPYTNPNNDGFDEKKRKEFYTNSQRITELQKASAELSKSIGDSDTMDDSILYDRDMETPENEYVYYCHIMPMGNSLDKSVFPQQNLLNFENYGSFTQVEDAGRKVWGKLTYSQPLQSLEYNGFKLTASKSNPVDKRYCVTFYNGTLEPEKYYYESFDNAKCTFFDAHNRDTNGYNVVLSYINTETSIESNIAQYNWSTQRYDYTSFPESEKKGLEGVPFNTLETLVKSVNRQQYIKETLNAHNTNAFEDCIRGNDVWGAWLTRMSTPEHPEDYIEIDTEGIRTQNLITTNVKFVINNVVKEYASYKFDVTKFLESKDFTDFEDVPNEVMDKLNQFAYEMDGTITAFNNHISDIVDNVHPYDEHFNLLDNNGFEHFPDRETKGFSVPPTVTVPFTESSYFLTNETMTIDEAERRFAHAEAKAVKDLANGGYYKTDFIIKFVYDGVPDTYHGRIDIGDGSNESIIDHIERHIEYLIDHPNEFDLYTEEQVQQRLEDASFIKNLLIPHLKDSLGVKKEEEMKSQEEKEKKEQSSTKKAIKQTLRAEALEKEAGKIVEEKQNQLNKQALLDSINDLSIDVWDNMHFSIVSLDGNEVRGMYNLTHNSLGHISKDDMYPEIKEYWNDIQSKLGEIAKELRSDNVQHIIKFESLGKDKQWHEDFLSNDGKGYTLDEAQKIVAKMDSMSGSVDDNTRYYIIEPTTQEELEALRQIEVRNANKQTLLESINNVAIDEDGYVHFSIVSLDGYELEGLYRTHDTANGEDNSLVSIDYGYHHPEIKEYWNDIQSEIGRIANEMQQPKQRVYFDLDGTCALWQPVAEEELYEEGYYRNLPPYENVVQAIDEIIQENPELEVNILSKYLTGSKYAQKEKLEWVKEHLPNIQEENIILVPYGKNKFDYIEGGLRESDHLIDDFSDNFNGWQPPAKAIKILNGINNTKGTWQGNKISAFRDVESLKKALLDVIKNGAEIKDLPPQLDSSFDYEAFFDERQGYKYSNFADNHREMIADKNKQYNNRTTIVINAFGGAGAGKTVACMDICQQLKKQGYNAEYVSEYCKDLVYENSDMLSGTAKNQFKILQEQMRRVDRLIGQVDFVVTDSPILLNSIYNKELTPEYEEMVTSLFNQYDNFTFVVERDKSHYQTEGRIHTLEESIEKDNEITKMLKDKDIYFGTYNHDTIHKVVNNSIRTFERVSKEKEQSKSMEAQLVITGFEVKDMVHMANYTLNGKAMQSAVWEQDGDLYIRTGSKITKDLMQHNLTPEQSLAYRNFVNKNMTKYEFPQTQNEKEIDEKNAPKFYMVVNSENSTYEVALDYEPAFDEELEIIQKSVALNSHAGTISNVEELPSINWEVERSYPTDITTEEYYETFGDNRKEAITNIQMSLYATSPDNELTELVSPTELTELKKSDVIYLKNRHMLSIDQTVLIASKEQELSAYNWTGDFLETFTLDDIEVVVRDGKYIAESDDLHHYSRVEVVYNPSTGLAEGNIYESIRYIKPENEINTNEKQTEYIAFFENSVRAEEFKQLLLQTISDNPEKLQENGVFEELYNSIKDEPINISEIEHFVIGDVITLKNGSTADIMDNSGTTKITDTTIITGYDSDFEKQIQFTINDVERVLRNGFVFAERRDEGMNVSIDADKIEKMYQYECDNQIATKERLTEWFADYNMAILKTGVDIESFNRQYDALFTSQSQLQITEESKSVHFDGYKGTYYTIDSSDIDGKKVFLMESERYGDEVACLVVDADGKILFDKEMNGFDDYKYHLLTVREELAEKIIKDWEEENNTKFPQEKEMPIYDLVNEDTIPTSSLEGMINQVFDDIENTIPTLNNLHIVTFSEDIYGEPQVLHSYSMDEIDKAFKELGKLDCKSIGFGWEDSRFGEMSYSVYHHDRKGFVNLDCRIAYDPFKTLADLPEGQIIVEKIANRYGKENLKVYVTSGNMVDVDEYYKPNQSPALQLFNEFKSEQEAGTLDMYTIIPRIKALDTKNNPFVIYANDKNINLDFAEEQENGSYRTWLESDTETKTDYYETFFPEEISEISFMSELGEEHLWFEMAEEVQLEMLVRRIDNLMYEYDTYEYNDQYPSREVGIDETLHTLLQRPEVLLTTLNTMLEEADEPEKRKINSVLNELCEYNGYVAYVINDASKEVVTFTDEQQYADFLNDEINVHGMNLPWNRYVLNPNSTIEADVFKRNFTNVNENLVTPVNQFNEQLKSDLSEPDNNMDAIERILSYYKDEFRIENDEDMLSYNSYFDESAPYYTLKIKGQDIHVSIFDIIKTEDGLYHSYTDIPIPDNEIIEEDENTIILDTNNMRLLSEPFSTKDIESIICNKEIIYAKPVIEDKEEIEVNLATKLDDFMYEYNSNEYNDQYDNRSAGYEDMLYNIQNNPQAILSSLTTKLEESYQPQKGKIQSLINELCEEKGYVAYVHYEGSNEVLTFTDEQQYAEFLKDEVNTHGVFLPFNRYVLNPDSKVEFNTFSEMFEEYNNGNSPQSILQTLSEKLLDAEGSEKEELKKSIFEICQLEGYVAYTYNHGTQTVETFDDIGTYKVHLEYQIHLDSEFIVIDRFVIVPEENTILHNYSDIENEIHKNYQYEKESVDIPIGQFNEKLKIIMSPENETLDMSEFKYYSFVTKQERERSLNYYRGLDVIEEIKDYYNRDFGIKSNDVLIEQINTKLHYQRTLPVYTIIVKGEELSAFDVVKREDGLYYQYTDIPMPDQPLDELLDDNTILLDENHIRSFYNPFSAEEIERITCDKILYNNEKSIQSKHLSEVIYVKSEIDEVPEMLDNVNRPMSTELQEKENSEMARPKTNVVNSAIKKILPEININKTDTKDIVNAISSKYGNTSSSFAQVYVKEYEQDSSSEVLKRMSNTIINATDVESLMARSEKAIMDEMNIDNVCIYQIIDNPKMHGVSYRNYEHNIQNNSGLQPQHYVLVHSEPHSNRNLEQIFSDKQLSVSNIVGMWDEKSNTRKLYYVDSLGFKEMKDFDIFKSFTYLTPEEQLQQSIHAEIRLIDPTEESIKLDGVCANSTWKATNVMTHEGKQYMILSAMDDFSPYSTVITDRYGNILFGQKENASVEEIFKKFVENINQNDITNDNPLLQEDRPATDKQKRFASKIANALNIAMPEEETGSAYSNYIKENLVAYNNLPTSVKEDADNVNPDQASEKQIAFAKTIAETLNINLPEGTRKADYQYFISKYRKQYTESVKNVEPEKTPSKTLTEEEYLEKVKANGSYLKDVPRESRTEQIIETALSSYGAGIKYLSEDEINENRCLIAVGQYGKSLRYVPPTYRTFNVCLEAYTNDHGCLNDIPKDLRKSVKEEYRNRFPESVESKEAPTRQLNRKELQNKGQEWADEIKEMIDNNIDNPEVIFEAIEFAGKFYQYSLLNMKIMHRQNRGITYVGTKSHFEKLGYNINANQEPMFARVPIFQYYVKDPANPNKRIYKNQYTKEILEGIKNGDIQEQHYVKGFMFQYAFYDIAQTDCPPEDYPKLFNMGHSSEVHSQLFDAMKEFATEHLGYNVSVQDLSSISLRGSCNYSNRLIKINRLLQDSEALGTLAHEIGHAILHGIKAFDEKSTYQKEVEADILSIMIQTNLGLPIGDVRKKHLIDNYKSLEKEAGGNEVSLLKMVEYVQTEVFRKYITQMNTCIQKHISMPSPSTESIDLIREKAYYDVVYYGSMETDPEALASLVPTYDNAETLRKYRQEYGDKYEYEKFKNVLVPKYSILKPNRQTLFETGTLSMLSYNDFLNTYKTPSAIQDIIQKYDIGYVENIDKQTVTNIIEHSDSINIGSLASNVEQGNVIAITEDSLTASKLFYVDADRLIPLPDVELTSLQERKINASYDIDTEYANLSNLRKYIDFTSEAQEYLNYLEKYYNYTSPDTPSPSFADTYVELPKEIKDKVDEYISKLNAIEQYEYLFDVDASKRIVIGKQEDGTPILSKNVSSPQQISNIYNLIMNYSDYSSQTVKYYVPIESEFLGYQLGKLTLNKYYEVEATLVEADNFYDLEDVQDYYRNIESSKTCLLPLYKGECHSDYELAELRDYILTHTHNPELTVTATKDKTLEETKEQYRQDGITEEKMVFLSALNNAEKSSYFFEPSDDARISIQTIEKLYSLFETKEKQDSFLNAINNNIKDVKNGTSAILSMVDDLIDVENGIERILENENPDDDLYKSLNGIKNVLHKINNGQSIDNLDIHTLKISCEESIICLQTSSKELPYKTEYAEREALNYIKELTLPERNNYIAFDGLAQGKITCKALYSLDKEGKLYDVELDNKSFAETIQDLKDMGYKEIPYEELVEKSRQFKKNAQLLEAERLTPPYVTIIDSENISFTKGQKIELYDMERLANRINHEIADRNKDNPHYNEKIKYSIVLSYDPTDCITGSYHLGTEQHNFFDTMQKEFEKSYHKMVNTMNEQKIENAEFLKGQLLQGKVSMLHSFYQSQTDYMCEHTLKPLKDRYSEIKKEMTTCEDVESPEFKMLTKERMAIQKDMHNLEDSINQVYSDLNEALKQQNDVSLETLEKIKMNIGNVSISDISQQVAERVQQEQQQKMQQNQPAFSPKM